MRRVRRWLAFELGLLRAVVLWVRRRPDGVGEYDVAVPYGGEDRGTGRLFLGLAVVEIVVVELVVPWPAARHVLLVLGVWSLALVLGLVAAQRTRPHVAGPEGLLVRSGASVAVQLPWSVVARVERRTRHEHAAWTVDGDRLYLPVGGTTAIDVELADVVDVRLPFARTASVRAISFAADDPEAAVRALRRWGVAGGTTGTRGEVR